MSEEVTAFVRCDGAEQLRDSGLDLVEAARICLPQECFELGECLFDRVQVGTIGRQIEQLGASRADRSPYGRLLVAAQIVHHDDVARPQGWHQELYHPGEETLGVDRPIEKAGRGDAVASQPGHKGERPASAVWHLGNQALTSGAAAMCTGHVGLRPGLVDEDQAGRTNLVLSLPPLLAPPRDVSAILLAGAQAFF